MDPPSDEKPVFHLGIAMAGAVSAGAYTAGVFDFLIEALSEWQKAKDSGDPNVPCHEVRIAVVSGASAGGMTGAFGLLSMAEGVPPVEEPAVNPAQSWPVRRFLPGLYDAWVKSPRLFSDAAEETPSGSREFETPTFLDVGDLNSGEPVPPSLLNSDLLTEIARRALQRIPRSGNRFRFLTEPIHLFMTLSSLEGTPYPILFQGPRSGTKHVMYRHADHAHYAIRGLGESEFPKKCHWLEEWGDYGIDLDIYSLSKTNDQGELKDEAKNFAEAMLATGAFPFGLRARQWSWPEETAFDRALTQEAGDFGKKMKQLRESLRNDPDMGICHHVYVDGGMLNNEPFGLARWAIRDPEMEASDSPFDKDRAVIMIDPFIPPWPKDKDYAFLNQDREKDLNIGFVAGKFLSALLNQSQFKGGDIPNAINWSAYTRYLIGPSEEHGLASASLNAFGGFLDEAFREHDFQLGRRNCQKFLREQFGVGHESSIAPVYIDLIKREAVYPGSEKTGRASWPVIPLYGTAAEEVAAPPKPKLDARKLGALERAVKCRSNAMVSNGIRKLPFRWRLLAKLAWWLVSRRVRRRLLEHVEGELRKNDQISE